jgi:hypothetical protein
MDLALDLARRTGADVLLANDPDADRLAVAVPLPGGGWRPLTGDEIGILLADWLLDQGEGQDRLVVTSIVSSSMLSKLAAARRVAYAETLTGFKWIARVAEVRPDLRFVYGYEEALGSCVGTLVHDKDGITAALAFAELAAVEKARGARARPAGRPGRRAGRPTPPGSARCGLNGVDGLAQMHAAVDACRVATRRRLAGLAVSAVEDLRRGERLPPTEGVVLRGDVVRLIVRPVGHRAEAQVLRRGRRPRDRRGRGRGPGSGREDGPGPARRGGRARLLGVPPRAWPERSRPRPPRGSPWGHDHHHSDVDVAAARKFLIAHARVLDRRRAEVLFDGEPGAGALGALEGYRNADGGYGWGLEPDFRAPESQPGGALHAFEVFEDVAPAVDPRAGELCDWLGSVTLADGGMPFGLPVADATATAPFWAEADHTTSSLHITTAVAGAAWRVARHDPRWRTTSGWTGPRATAWTRSRPAPRSTFAIELLFVLDFLDTVVAGEVAPEAEALLARHAATVPASAELSVSGGAENEKLRPLDLSPWPDRPLRRHIDPAVIEADLDRLAGDQHADGGWDIDFRPYSPAAALEWRGYATVRALAVLRAHGRI